MSCRGLVLHFVVVVVGLYAVTSTHGLQEYADDVKHLIGEPDFRDVSLRWDYDLQPIDEMQGGLLELPLPKTFQIHYCELQAWGPHRCRNTVVEDSDEMNNQVSGVHGLATSHRKGRWGRTYSARINGLRMATTYSFEVRPLHGGAKMRTAKADLPAKSIIVPTKGFSARATQCLPHASEVEVSTGPHFGGRIAVEAADGERCAVQGDPNSGRDTYTLRIDHEECGSEVNDTTVATFVTVQENLPILTHSTRRFLVLCSYKPETLTIRAGINLPSNGANSHVKFYRPQSGQAEPYDVQDDAINEVQPARLAARIAEPSTGNTAQAVLMVILVMAGLAGVALLVWRVIPGSKNDLDTISVASYESSASRNTIQALDNQSDTASIYSISLSECGHCGDNSKQETDLDNTSEA